VAAGLVAEIRTRHNKQGKKMAFVTLEDAGGRLEVALFTEVLEEVGDILSKEAILVIRGEIDRDDFTGNMRMVAEKVWTVAQAREHFSKGLWIHWPQKQSQRMDVAAVARILGAHQGGRCQVYIDYRGNQVRACLELGKAWRIRLEDDLLRNLASQLGKEHIRVRYE